jgi:hypothetical protein
MKRDCLNTSKSPEELEDIVPPITRRTFPAWLPAEEADRLIPAMVVAENERLRNEKYKQLKVPLDEKERKKHCSVEANKAACAQFDKVQKQLSLNKENLYGIKDLDKPGQLDAYLNERRKQDPGSLGPADSVLGQAGQMAADDPNLPFKPLQKFKVNAPPPASAQAPKASEGLTDKAKKLGAAGGAAVLVTLTGIAAWGKSKLSQREAAKKAAMEIADEDAAAVRDGEFTRQSAEEALTPAQKSMLAELRANAGDRDAFIASNTTYWAQNPDLKAVLDKVRSGQIKL